MNPRSRTSHVLRSVLVVGIVLLIGPAPAPSATVHRDPEQLEPLLEMARNQARRGDGAEAGRTAARLAEYLDALGEGGAEPYLVPAGEGRWTEARLAVSELVASLPAEGRRTYLEARESMARGVVERAASRRNVDALGRAVRRFPGTEPGERARRLLVELLVERGDATRALGWLDGMTPPDDPGERTRLRLLRVLCLARLGRVEEAREVAAGLEGSVDLDGEPAPAGEVAARLIEEGPEGRARAAADLPWPALGGDPSHVSAAGGPPTLGSVGDPIAFPALETTEEARARFEAVGDAPPRFVAPVTDGETVVVPTETAARGIDLASGEVRWSHALEDEGLPGRIELDRRAAAIDGDRAFCLYSLHRPPAWSGEGDGASSRLLVEHRLVAHDLETGAVAWELPVRPGEEPSADANEEDEEDEEDGRDETEEDETEEDATRGGLWMAPPVASGGLVYVPYVRVAGDHEARLLAVEARSGEVAWDRAVATAAIPDRFARAVVPTPACVSGPRVYVQTGIGLLAALDARTGRIRWAVETGVRPGPAMALEVEERRRFDPTPPRLVEGHVVMAPPETASVVAVDASDRAIAWELPRDRFRQLVGGLPARAVEGASSGLVYLAGRDGALALEVATGRVAWGPVELEGPLLGQGAATPGGVLLPTSGGLVSLDPATGERLDSMAWLDPSEAGHVAVAGDRVLLAGPRALRVLEPAGEALDRLEDSGRPGDAVRAGEILLRRGRGREAVERFDAAIEALRPDPRRPPRQPEVHGRARDLAYRACLRLAEGRPADERADLLEEALRYSSSGQEELRTILDRAGALEEAGRPRDAVVAWNMAVSHYPGRMVRVEEGHLARIEAWASSRIGSLVEEHGRSVYDPLEREAARQFEAAARTGTAQGYRELIARYPHSRRVPDAYRALEDHYADADLEDRAAEVLRRFIRTRPDGSPHRGPALVRLVERYEDIGRHRDARWALDRLASGFGGETLRVEGRRVDVDDLVRRKRDLPAYRRAGTARAWLPADPDPVWRTMTNLVDRNRHFVEVANGPGSYLLLAGSTACEARRADGGTFLWEKGLADLDAGIDDVPLDDVGTPVLRGAGHVDGRLVLGMDEGLIGLDARTGEPLWVFDPDRTREAGPEGPEDSPTLVPEADPDPVRAVAFDERRVYCLLSSQRLAAVDARSGELVWTAPVPRLALGPLHLEGERIILSLQRPAGLLAVERETGRRAWNTRLPGPEGTTVSAGPTAVGDLVGCTHGVQARSVAMVRPSDGRLVWNRTFSFPLRDLVAGPGEGRVTAVTSRGEEIPAALVLDAESGQDDWVLPRTDGRVTQVRDGNEHLLVLLERFDRSRVVALRANDGQERWRFESRLAQQLEELLLTRRYVVAGNRASTGPPAVHLLDRETGGNVATRTLENRRIRDVLVLDGTLVCLTDRGLVGFGSVDAELQASLAADLVRTLSRASGGMAVDPQAELARRYLRLGETAEAARILEETLLAEGIGEHRAEQLYRQLAGVVEERSESSRPEIAIPPLVAPPAIDGSLSDWYDPTARVELGSPSHVWPIQGAGFPAYTWAGQGDLSGTLYMGWDERFFYLALDVNDDVLRAYDSEASSWVGDCLLLAIDMLGDGGRYFRPDDQLLSLALTRPRQQQQPGEEQEREQPEGKYFVKRRDDDTGAVYEARVPWSMFREAGARIPEGGPEPGFGFGLDVVVTDDDSAEGAEGRSRQALSWTPGVLLHESKERLWSGFVPDRFGRVILGER